MSSFLKPSFLCWKMRLPFMKPNSFKKGIRILVAVQWYVLGCLSSQLGKHYYMLLLPDLILLGKGFRNFLLQNFTTSTEKFSHLQLLFIADNFFNQTNIRFEAMFFGARSGGPETFFLLMKLHYQPLIWWQARWWHFIFFKDFLIFSQIWHCCKKQRKWKLTAAVVVAFKIWD